MLDRLLVDLFNVHRVPRHLHLTLISVLVEGARVDPLLGRSARSIQCKSLVHIDLRVDAKVVSTSDQDSPRLEHCVHALLLDLRELRMCVRLQ